MRSSVIVIIVLAMVLAGISSCRKNCKRKIHQKVYVANEESGTITVIDAETYEVLKTVDLTYKDKMYMAHNVQVAPDNQSVWITAAGHDHGNDYLMVLQGRRDKVKDRIEIGHDQHLAHVVLDDESRYAYATGYESNVIVKVDTKEMKETDRFDLGAGAGPHGLRYMNGYLYAACMMSKEVLRVNAESGSIQRLFLDGIGVQTAVLPGLNSVFVSVYDRKQVVRWNISTGDTVQIPLPAGSQGPIQLYPSPDNHRVYVCDQGIVNGNPASNKLYVIDTGTNTVTGTVTVGNGAHGVCTNGDGTKVFVTNLSDNTVSVVDAASLSVEATIEVGSAPNGISFLQCDCD